MSGKLEVETLYWFIGWEITRSFFVWMRGASAGGEQTSKPSPTCGSWRNPFHHHRRHRWTVWSIE